MEMVPSSAEQTNRMPATANGQRLRGAALASVLAALMLTLFLSALDQTIVNTALPRILGELHGFDRYIWPVTAYLLASTTVIPIVGKLGDQFGRKWFLIVGVAVFLTGSALSGASQSINQLIIFRGLQGLGAGVLMSQVFTIIGDIFVPAERARWQGLFAGVFALASVVGPTAGGFITDNASWRWVFYINLPIGAVALFLLVTRLPGNLSVRTGSYRGWAAIRRIDFLGAFAAAGFTVCLLLGLTWGGQTYAWNSTQVVSVLIGSVCFLVLFFIVERFIASEPVLPLDLFRNRVFAAGALLSLTVGMALFAVIFYLPLFIQGVLGQTATSSGAVITPLTLTLAIGAILVGQVISRLGRYQAVSIIGAFILGGGVFLLTQLGAGSALGEVTRDMIVVGIGIGMLQPVLTLAVQNAIPRNRLGVGTGAVTYLRSMGSTLGVAIIGAIESNVLTSELAHRLPATAAQVPSAVLSRATDPTFLIQPGAKDALVNNVTQVAVDRATTQAVAQAIAAADAALPPGPARDKMLVAIAQQTKATVTTQVTGQVHDLFAQIFEATRQALAVGIQHAFVGGLIICGVIVVVTFFLKDVPLVQRAPAASPEAAIEEAIGIGEVAMADGAGQARTEVVPSRV